MQAGSWLRLILAGAVAALALPGAARAAPPVPLGVAAHREAVAFANTIGTRPSASAAERRVSTWSPAASGRPACGSRATASTCPAGGARGTPSACTDARRAA